MNATQIIELIIKSLEIFISYALPIAAIIISILAYKDSKKVNQLQVQLNRYELEKLEKEKQAEDIAKVEARIINIAPGKYKLKIWNSGKSTAYNVDYKVDKEHENRFYKDKTPYEFLGPNKNFEEHAILYMGVARKVMLTTIWEDRNGNQFTEDQMVDF